MKNLTLILACVGIGTLAFGQNNLVNQGKDKIQNEGAKVIEQGKEELQKAKDDPQTAKEKLEKGKKVVDEEITKLKEKKAKKSNNGVDKEGLSGKEFGEKTSSEAKSKSKPVSEIKNDAEATEIIAETKEDNKKTIKNVGDKLAKAKKTLEDKKILGEISESEYLEKAKALVDYENRMEKLKSSINK